MNIKLFQGNITQSFPFMLYGDHAGQREESAICLRGKLPRNKYCMKIRIMEAEHNQLLVVFLNGKPIDSLGVPFWGDSDDNWPYSRRDRVQGERHNFVQDVKERYGLSGIYEERKKNQQEWILQSRFIVNDEKAVSIEIRNANGDRCGPLFYHGDGVQILGIEINEDSSPVPDTFSRNFPGLPMLDAWGWMAYLDFDNPDGKEATFDKVLYDAVIQARKWGANMLELNPAVKDGHFFDFEGDGGAVAGTQVSPSTQWTTAMLRDLFRECHKRGIMIELFLFCLGGFSGFTRLTSEQILCFYKRVNKLLGCRDSYEDTLAAIDGVIYEMFPHDAPRQTNEAWQVNPGVFQMVSGGITGTALELKNNGYSAAFGNYTAHWVGCSAQQTGYDWLFPAVPYPKEFCRRENEIGYSYLQGCAESHRAAEMNAMRTGYVLKGIPGRDAAPDWIISQITAFAGRRWRDEDDNIASSLCWEAVGDLICPPETKRTVYAVSQDPIRSCVCGVLKDTGCSGTIDLKRLMKKDPEETLTRLLCRHEFPMNTRFMRNQDLEFLSLAGRDYNVLQMDLSRSARFYGNGSLTRVFAPFFSVGTETDAVIDIEEHYEEMEKGGALIKSEQRLNFHDINKKFCELRTFIMITDTPGIKMELKRNLLSRNAGGDIQITNLLAPDPHYQSEIMLDDGDELVVCLVDHENVLPNAICRIRSENTQLVNPVLEKGLISFKTVLDFPHIITIELFFGAGHFSGIPLNGLLEQNILGEIPNSKLIPEQQPMQLQNKWELPVTGVVSVTGTGDKPCRIKEKGWWHFRGLSPSDEFADNAFVKVNYHPGDQPEIAFDDFINGQITWGWGSQYQLLISPLEQKGEIYRAQVEVARTTPFIFAPRVRLNGQVAEVKLDGDLWHYIDHDTVFLPNKPGRYELQWSYGKCEKPRICRTYATILKTEFHNESLSVVTELPPHVVVLPKYHDFYCLIEWNGVRKIRKINIGKTVIKKNEF